MALTGKLFLFGSDNEQQDLLSLILVPYIEKTSKY